MDHDPGCEAREALDLVGRTVVMCDGASGDEVRTPTERLGLPTFDEVAVVEYHHGRPEVVVSSGPRIEDAVELEARAGGGPSTEAVRSAELVVCRDLQRERRWAAPMSTSWAERLGLRRLVAVPLRLPGEPAIGAIVLAGRAPGIITPDEVSAVAALADHSSLVLTARVARCRETRAFLALDRMRLVGLAVGVVMATEGLAEIDALSRLRTRSQRSGCRLFETAAAVLTEKEMSFQ